MTFTNAKGTLAVCAFAHRAVLNAGSRSFRRLLFHGPATRLFLAVLPIFAIFSPQFLPAQTGPLPAMSSDHASPVCPANASSTNKILNVPEYHGPRASVGGDYVVIEYNANSLLTSWSDYKRIFDLRGQNNLAHRIDANGSFLPVIDAKEKIAVRVCGLHFTDVLTVTTSPTGVPEGGADIRGATVVTPPVSSLSSTLDTLQSGTTTGGTTALPGLGLSAPTALPSLSLSGITPGALGAEDQTPGKYPTYTPATVTASGKQVALQLYALQRNAQELIRLVNRTLGCPYDRKIQGPEAQTQKSKTQTECDADPATTNFTNDEKSRSAPGSVNGIDYIVGVVLDHVKSEDGEFSNSAAFDKEMTDTQNINAQISTLSGALTSQAFATNTLALLNNFSALRGLLDLAQLGKDKTNCQSNQAYLQTPKLNTLSADDLGKLTIDYFANLTPAELLTFDATQLDLLPKPPKGSKERSLEGKVVDMQNALKKAGVKPSTTNASDKPLCSLFEEQKYTDFWDSYYRQVAILFCAEYAECKATCKDDANCMMGSFSRDDINRFEGKVGDELFNLNDYLTKLRSKLGEIDTKTTELYDRMNEWYQNSSIEQTDLLQPLTANSFLRISIIVQRGYIPFTLANASGSFTPTVSTNVVPTAAATASTSTPAHAVKTILVEVHRVANFNLMGGVMLIHVPTTNYGLQASPTPAVATTATTTTNGTTTTTVTGYTANCAGQMTSLPVPASATPTSPAPSYSCLVQTQQTQWQVAGMAGLVWFPWGHDYFPRHSGYANFGRNLLPSALLATSVTSLGNSMGGVNWEPVSGLDFYVGLGSAHKMSLPSGLIVNSALESGSTLSQVTTEHAGFAIGVGFDLSVITQMFSSKTTSIATMP
jgi:hypothetical protein